MTIEGGVLGLPVVWDKDCLLHEPAGEVWLGLREDGTEVPERATVILKSLTSAGAEVAPPWPRPRRAARRARPRTRRAPGHDLDRLGERRAILPTTAGTGSYRTSSRPRPAGRPPAAAAGRDARPGRPFLLRHHDACRARQLGGDPGRSGLRPDRSGANLRRRAGRLRPLPPARPPRRAGRLRRLLLPQQCGRGSAGAAAGGRGPRRGAGHRCSPRQRHAGDLLCPARRLLRKRPRRPRRRLVPALRGLRR